MVWIFWGSFYLEFSGILDVDVYFLAQLGKFSAIIFSNSFPFSFFSPSEILIMQYYSAWCFFKGPLRNLYFLLFFLFAALSIWFPCFVFQLTDLFCFIQSAFEPFQCTFQFDYYILQLCYCCLNFLIFYLFVEKIHCVYPFFSLFQWAYLWSLLWTLFSGILLISVSSMSFSEVLTCSFIWNIFFPILIFPETLYLFLCIRRSSFSQSWRSGHGKARPMF